MTNTENHELSTADVQEALIALLEGYAEDEVAELVTDQVRMATTFSNEGLMTSNLGVVVSLKDGSQFQITIVRSR
jgi:hypothetical protein